MSPERPVLVHPGLGLGVLLVVDGLVQQRLLKLLSLTCTANSLIWPVPEQIVLVDDALYLLLHVHNLPVPVPPPPTLSLIECTS